MDFVGQQVAATGASQSRVIKMAERTRTKIGAEKLRKTTSLLAESMEVHREACQLRQLQQWINQEKDKNTVLSISRDEVSISIATKGYFEMASVATLSVYL